MTSIRLNHLAAARALGEEAGSFLQAQFAADLTRLGDGDACFSAYCDARGNVIALLRVIRQSEAYVLIAASDLMETVLSTLRKYVLRARVRFEPLDRAVVGEQTGEALEYGLGDAPGGSTELAEWRARELRAGITWLSPPTSGRYLPQMLGLQRLGAVSFRKGCFPGQEVIARVHYLGKLKRLPLIVSVAGRPAFEAGAEVGLIGADGPVGEAEIVDSAATGEETVCFLAARNRQDGSVIAVESGGARFEVQTCATM